MELDVASMILKDWRERVNQMDIVKIIERSRRKASPSNGWRHVKHCEGRIELVKCEGGGFNSGQHLIFVVSVF